MRHLFGSLSLSAALVLVLFAGSVGPAAAAVTGVRWNVGTASAYTVTNNGAQPLVSYRNCLQTNTTYTIPVTVTVEGTGSFSARFATVGEATQFLSGITFSPTTVTGTDSQTFNVTVTLKTGANSVAEPGAPPPNRFGIYLEPTAGAAPLADSFLTIDIRCITTGGTAPGLPNTGAGGMADEGPPAFLTAGIAACAIFCGTYALRRRRASKA